MILDRAVLIVRDLAPGSAEIPDVPAGWSVRPEEATRWLSVLTPAGDRILAFRAAVRAGRGLFAIFGPADVLASIEASSALAMSAREAWARRLEPAVLAYLRYWPWLMCDGEAESGAFEGVPVRVAEEGEAMPLLPLPWYLRRSGAAATALDYDVRVDAIARPALPVDVAGLALVLAFDAEPA